MTNLEEVQHLILSPRETLSLELKSWISPDIDSDKAKIIKTLLALRNHDGGHLLIGFDDKSCKPIFEEAPKNPKTLFHQDIIQKLINSFASEQFEIEVFFPKIDDQEFVVLKVNGGITTPVVTKRDLKETNPKKTLIKPNTLYTRTLRANNTPSTSEATWKDWPEILNICFDNREANIANFIKRHLKGSSIEELKTILNIQSNEEHKINDSKILSLPKNIMEQELNNRSFKIPFKGSYEIGIKIIGEIKKLNADTDFLNLISSVNPNLSGNPPWLDSRNSDTIEFRPFVKNKAWLTLINYLHDGNVGHFEFWRISTLGEMYLFRLLQDDIDDSLHRPSPESELDYILMIIKISEAMVSAMKIAEAMTDSSVVLNCTIRWSGMRGRKISTWANPLAADPLYNMKSSQDQVIANFELSTEASITSIADVLTPAINNLLNCFGGFSVDQSEVSLWFNRLIQRRLW